MSKSYDEYIENHKKNVSKAFQWLIDNKILEGFTLEDLNGAQHQCEFSHDQSKYDKEEYDAYDAYFYGGNKSYAVVQDFNKAWLHHIHRNPHHWQYWVLINDDPDEGEIILDMPNNYIIEMICDWWSFSWNKGKLDEIFNWYDEHKSHMKLSRNTREKVEDILQKIKAILEEENNDRK